MGKEPGKRERGGAERITPPRNRTGSEETNECRHSKLTQQTKAKAGQVVGNAAKETDARWRRRWNHRKTKLEDRRKETARKKEIRAKTWEDKRARKEMKKKLAQDQWRAEKSHEGKGNGRKASACPHGRETEDEPMVNVLQGARNPKSQRRREKDRMKKRERRNLKRRSRMERGHHRSQAGRSSSLHRTVTPVYVDLAIRFQRDKTLRESKDIRKKEERTHERMEKERREVKRRNNC